VPSLPPTVKLWFATAPVDMRLGFDGLHELVRSRLQADPLSGHLFIFRNRTADRVEVLYWGGHGLCLWCTRLERGRYHFPAATTAGVRLTPGEFQMVLDGIDLSHAKRFTRYRREPTP